MNRRKIEAWTGDPKLAGSSLIGALVLAENGAIEQIDDRLKTALKDLVPSPDEDLDANLLSELRSNGYPDAVLSFPWNKEPTS